MRRDVDSVKFSFFPTRSSETKILLDQTLNKMQLIWGKIISDLDLLQKILIKKDLDIAVIYPILEKLNTNILTILSLWKGTSGIVISKVDIFYQLNQEIKKFISSNKVLQKKEFSLFKKFFHTQVINVIIITLVVGFIRYFGPPW